MRPFDITNEDDWTSVENANIAKLKQRRASKGLSEGALQRRIADALIKLGYLVVRYNSSMHYTQRGTPLSAIRVLNTNATAGHPDLVVYRNGKATFVEIKTQTGKQSRTQKTFQSLAASHGMEYVIFRSVDEAITWAQA